MASQIMQYISPKIPVIQSPAPPYGARNVDKPFIQNYRTDIAVYLILKNRKNDDYLCRVQSIKQKKRNLLHSDTQIVAT